MTQSYPGEQVRLVLLMTMKGKQQADRVLQQLVLTREVGVRGRVGYPR
jgi:hypothetical protein